MKSQDDREVNENAKRSQASFDSDDNGNGNLESLEARA
jgi:hypothetical protein